MKDIFYFVLLLGSVVLKPSLAISEENQPSRSSDLRVMSFNIRYGTARDGENHWEKRRDFVVETIKAYNPDLLGTQETLGFQKEYLQKNLTGYSNIGVGRNDGKLKGEMTAIFFRKDRFEKLDEGHFWLSTTPEKPGSKSWDSSLPRICSWVKLRDRKSKSKPILFLNTHFDHRGKQARFESAKLIRKRAQKLAKDCDVIITGDFNATVSSKPYQALFQNDNSEASKIQLVDTYKVGSTESNQSEATFSGFRAGPVKGGRIDWIAVSTGWKVIRAEINRTSREGRTPSDHYPVTATLQR